MFYIVDLTSHYYRKEKLEESLGNRICKDRIEEEDFDLKILNMEPYSSLLEIKGLSIQKITAPFIQGLKKMRRLL